MLGFRELDRVLRGEAAEVGEAGPAALVRVNVLLAAASGVCMGVYGLFRPDDPEPRQMIASTLKVPALLFLTLLVTFPSLYVFNTLLGSRLRFGELLRLVVSGMSVLVAVLAAFGPIVAFFSVTTTSYPFIVLLNVAVFAVSGTFGMAFLYNALAKLAGRPAAPSLAEGSPAPADPRARGPVNGVFYAWMLVFGLVGAQMGWVLRPFIGSPDVPFTWFRPRQASFFEGVAQALRTLFGG
jgi:hypothetical protein